MGNAASKSTRSPAFQFYPRDFLSSSKVDQMSMTERGVYITLLSKCWLDDGLPTDLVELAGMVRMKAPLFERMWKNGQVGRCFYERGGKLQNERLDRERKAQADYRRRQTDNVNKRWDKQKRNDGGNTKAGNTTVLPAPLVGNTLQSSSSSSSSSATAVSASRAPLVQRRKGNAAWEGARGLYVQADQHTRFVGFRDHDGAENELLAFYERTAETFKGQIDPNMYRFWDARYAEEWPPTPAVKDTRPEWMKKAGVPA